MGITPGSSQRTAKRLWELFNHPNTSCCFWCCFCCCASCLAVVSLPFPFSHIYRAEKAALPDYDWQKQPIPSANQPQDFQGLEAVVMSFREWHVTDEYIPIEATSEISCIHFTPQWLIRCSWRICIICHCAVGPPPLQPGYIKCGGKIPTCCFWHLHLKV